MNAVDIIFLIPLLWLSYKGFRKGLVIEVFSLLGLILGIYCSIHFSDITYGLLQRYVGNGESYLPLISYAVTFIGVVIGVHFLGKVLEKLVDFSALTVANKLLGCVFGTLKGLVLICAILMVFNPLNERWQWVSAGYLNESVLYRPISGMLLKWGPHITDNETFRQMEEGFNALLPIQP